MALSTVKPAGKRPAKQAEDVNWFEDAVEVPRPGTEPTARLASRQRLIRWYVWGSVVCAPLFALISLVEASGSGGTNGSAAAQAPTGAEVAAWQEVQAWVSQSPSPLPGADIVAWTKATEIPRASAKGERSSVAEAAFDEDFLVRARGGYYEVTVEVVYVPGSGPVAVAGPSFAPVVPNNQAAASGASPWPGLAAASSVPAPVSTAISSWLSAYTSGNPESLLQATGDPSTSDTYTPLSGIASASVDDIVGAALYGPPGQMIVEAQFFFTWRGQSSVAVANQQVPTTMDLLVERAGTATPSVVAWGPPGSGPSLRPFENAVTAVQSG